MNKQYLKKYARLIAEVGINVQKKEEVWINASLDQPDFVVMVMEECYKLGAKKVIIRGHIQNLQLFHINMRL